MEKLKCRLSLLFVFSLLLVSIFTLKDASALELTGGNALEFKSGTLTTGNGTINATKSHSDLIFQVNNNFVYGLDFDYSTTAIPSSDYLLTFTVTYKSVYGTAGGSNYTGHYRYDGLQSETMNKLAESCVTNDETPVTSSGGVVTWYGEGQLTCSYLFFSHAGYNSFSSHTDSRIWYTETNGSGSQIIVTPGFVRGINFNSLTDDDRAWLEEHMPAGSSTADIESAIESAREEEKTEYENQADETEDTVNDESSAAQGTATSLLSVVGQFIGVLTSAQPTNCNLNGNLIPHLPLGNLNLCQNDPPAAIVVLGSLLLIAFVVPLAYHTVKRMLSLIGSFQS